MTASTLAYRTTSMAERSKSNRACSPVEGRHCGTHRSIPHDFLRQRGDDSLRWRGEWRIRAALADAVNRTTRDARKAIPKARKTRRHA
jgi:hypothetical protein